MLVFGFSMKKRKNPESDQEKARQGGLVDVRDHLRLLGQAVVDQLQGGLAPLAGVDPLDHVVFERLSKCCLLYTSPSPRDRTRSRMPSSA